MTANAQRPQATKARVFLVDDEAIVRTALRLSMEGHPRLTVVGEAADELLALDQIQLARPDVAVIDLSLRNGDGVALIRQLRRSVPGTKVLVFTSHDSPFHVTSALGAGAHGYVLKQDGTCKLLEALRLLLDGKAVVSERLWKRVVGFDGPSTIPAPELPGPP